MPTYVIVKYTKAGEINPEVHKLRKNRNKPTLAEKLLSCRLKLTLSELLPLIHKGAQQQLFTWPSNLSKERSPYVAGRGT